MMPAVPPFHRPKLRDARRPGSPRRRTPRCVPEIIALCALLAAAAQASAQRTLLYRLRVGDLLVYDCRTSVTSLEGNKSPRYTNRRVRIWGLRRDGERLLVLLDVGPVGTRGAQRGGVGLVWLDAGGTRDLPPEIQTRRAPLDPGLDLLPLLARPFQSEAAWESAPDLYGRRWHCRNRGPDADHHGQRRVDFDVHQIDGIDELLGLSRSGSFWFDTVGGCVGRFESQETDQRRKTRSRVVAVLHTRRVQTSGWAARRADEAERFLRVLRHEDRLLHEVVTRPQELERTLRELDRLWSTFKSDVDSRDAAPFGRLADERRRALQGLANVFRRRAGLGQRWLGQAARTWTLQSPSGETFTSEATRQGVVVECFWSAESLSGLCVLDSMRRLQTELRREPVRIVCYNMDVDVFRARQAVARCGGELTHLLAGPLQSVEKLDELPVVRVLDAGGIVRDVWIGWQPDYNAAGDLATKLAKAARR